MRNYAFAFAFILAFLLLAGCAQTQQQPAPPSGGLKVSISMLSAPASAETGSPMAFRWGVSADKAAETMHTAVHYGYSSVPTDPTPAKYALKTQIFTGPLPAEFTGVVTFDKPGTVYYRAHVIVEDKHYWTDEGTITVTGTTQAPDLSGLDQADAGVQQSIDELEQVK